MYQTRSRLCDFFATKIAIICYTFTINNIDHCDVYGGEFTFSFSLHFVNPTGKPNIYVHSFSLEEYMYCLSGPVGIFLFWAEIYSWVIAYDSSVLLILMELK